ncbi:cystatin-F [Aplochiton taeniatus]
MSLCYKFLVLSLLALECVHGSMVYNHPVPGAPRNISKNDKGVQKAALAGTFSFNNLSNDAFLFKPLAINEAQRQIVKGIKYILEADISRTVCRKKTHEDLVNCDFQPDGSLHQTFSCHFEVWTIPWLHVTKTTYFNCQP